MLLAFIVRKGTAVALLTTHIISSRRSAISLFSSNPNNMSAEPPVPPQPNVQESVIRKMTRLAVQYNAVNLSQGFPNEPPPRKVRLALAQAVLSGNVGSKDEGLRLKESTEEELTQSLLTLLNQPVTEDEQSKTDELNQYSPPMGRPDSRREVSQYYQRLYDYTVSEDDITLTLGATEACATALRTVGKPGDKVVIFEPFHELYPSQCAIFYLEPVFVTLCPCFENGTWEYDEEELKKAIVGAKALVLNTPHNPTGKVFHPDDIKKIVDLCIKNEVYIITDEIYEHMCYSDTKHTLIPKMFPEAAKWTLVCNSLGKSASATGWRLGWALHPPHLSDIFRAVHDQMVAMAPHPMQYASLAYLNLPMEYFLEELPKRYRHRIKILAKALKEAGFQVIVPEGSYYLFVDYRTVNKLKDLGPMEAAMYLMEKVGVACVPGDNFYGKSSDGQHFLRFAACRSTSDIEAAIERLKILSED